MRRLKAGPVVELAERRGAVVARRRGEVADLEFVNGGGTGSLETTAADPSVTEVAAGSGLFAPALFDGYDAFDLRPAAFFGLAVSRRPAPGLVTVAGGGWVASGPIGPRPAARCRPTPRGCGCSPSEGAGEVQTPLRGGRPPTRCAVGDRVWFRHAKAGELCERVDALHLVGGRRRGGRRRADLPRRGPHLHLITARPGTPPRTRPARRARTHRVEAERGEPVVDQLLGGGRWAK